jgi:hypothetical protein
MTKKKITLNELKTLVKKIIKEEALKESKYDGDGIYGADSADYPEEYGNSRNYSNKVNKLKTPFSLQEIELINKCVNIYSNQKVNVLGGVLVTLPSNMYNKILQLNKYGVDSYGITFEVDGSEDSDEKFFNDFSKFLKTLKDSCEEIALKSKENKIKQDNKFMDDFNNRGKLKGLNVVGKIDLKEGGILDEAKGLYDNYIEDYQQGKKTNLLITLRIDKLSDMLSSIKKIFNTISGNDNVLTGGMYTYRLTSANYNPEVNFLYLRFEVTYSDDYYDLSSVTSSKIINEVINNILHLKERGILYKIIHKTNLPQNISDIKVNNLFLS